MRDLLPALKEWINSGEKFALATVISTWGSAPRKAGSYMAIREDGAILGSVSGGCVEGAVISQANEVIETKVAKRLHFGVADETAWDVGLACGGEIDIFLQTPKPEILGRLVKQIENESMVIHAFSLAESNAGMQMAVENYSTLRGVDSIPNLDSTTFKSQIVDGIAQEKIFVNPIPPSPQLVIVGGVQIAQSLAKLARMAHFRPILVDPRKAFLNVDRFPDEEIIQKYPAKAFENIQFGPSTALASLTHDPKIDDPALLGALQSEAFYIGALGSRKTHAKRIERLKQAGATLEALERIKGPIGLSIGADNPEEIALAIMAQIIQVYRS